jgi:hypothetical protein
MADYSSFIIGEPLIVKLKNNQILVSGKCSWCCGRGTVYMNSDYTVRSCYPCASSGWRTIITEDSLETKTDNQLK